MHKINSNRDRSCKFYFINFWCHVKNDKRKHFIFEGHIIGLYMEIALIAIRSMHSSLCKFLFYYHLQQHMLCGRTSILICYFYVNKKIFAYSLIDFIFQAFDMLFFLYSWLSYTQGDCMKFFFQIINTSCMRHTVTSFSTLLFSFS